MWKLDDGATGLWLGSYDYNKKTGKRYFELFGLVNGKKVRKKFNTVALAKKAGFKVVK